MKVWRAPAFPNDSHREVRKMMLRLRLLTAAILMASFLLIGCKGSSNPNAPAKVHGSVTYNGSPVSGGTVTFHTKDGIPMTFPIDSDGNYTAPDIAEGEMVVTVETESVNPDANKMQEYKGGTSGMASKMDGMANYGKGGSGAAPGGGGVKGPGQQMGPTPEGFQSHTKYVKIPAKYSDKATSGLSVTLKKGDQSYSIKLTD